MLRRPGYRGGFPGSFKITLVDFKYQPACVKARRTGSLTVTNSGSVTHNFSMVGTIVVTS